MVDAGYTTQHFQDAGELPRAIQDPLGVLGEEQPGAWATFAGFIQGLTLEFLYQEYQYCRKPERTLNKCMFEKLVSALTLFPKTSQFM